MGDEPPLDVPGNRRRFLSQVARGLDHEACAAEIGTTIRTVQRYAGSNGAFKTKFKEAKRQGLTARRAPERADQKAKDRKARARARAAKKEVAKRAAERKRERGGLAVLEQSAAEAAPQAFLEEMELAQPQGLKLNPHLPPLSVSSHLGMCQAFAFDKKEHPAVRREAMRQIGMHTLLPALRPPPPRNETGTVAEAQQPKLAIPGSGVRVVVLKAPDNGMYAPGCGPGDATVVDEAEAADAELVTATSPPTSGN